MAELDSRALTLEEALCDRLDPLGWVGTRTTRALNDLIAEHEAVVRVNELPGGGITAWQRLARVRVEVFAATYRDVWGCADQARDLLVRQDAFVAGGWLVDDITAESDFAESYYADGVRYLSATFRVATRS